MAQKPKNLLDQVRETVCLKHYAYRTEQTYVDWVRRYILFHNKNHPKDMGENEVQEFLAYLASERKVSASTKNQALSALIFLYRHVLHKEFDLPTRLITAKRSTHLPTVLTPIEVRNVLQYVGDTAGRIARLLYGSGMRLQECLRFIDFGNHRIIVRSAKGANERSTLLPETLIEPLQFRNRVW